MKVCILLNRAFLALGLGVSLLSSQVHAAAVYISGVTIADTSSEGNYGRYGANLLDGSGLDLVTGYHSTDPTGNMWNTISGAPYYDYAPEITFDLGDLYDMNSIRVWNYNESYTLGDTYINCGLKDVEILVNSSLGGAFTSLGTFTFNKASGTSNVDFSQVIDLSGYAAADVVREIRFVGISTWHTTLDNAGLSEVRFSGVQTVPEPSHALLSILGVLGFLARRRR